MGKRARRGGRSELAREIRAGVRDSHNQVVSAQPGRPVPTQGPTTRTERPRPSLAPGYLSPASAAAAADAEFPEDWPRAESPVAEANSAAAPEVGAAVAAAPWRRAAGPQAKQAPERAEEQAPERAEDSESCSGSEHGSEQVTLLEHYNGCAADARAKGDEALAARYLGYAEEERRLCGLGGRRGGSSDTESSEPPAAGYEVSLSSEGELSTSTPRASRSRSRSPDTPEVYREFDRDDREFDREFERLEICSIEFSQDGGAGSSSGGAAAGHDGASGGSRAGARPAARGRGRRPPWVRPWKADRGTR